MYGCRLKKLLILRVLFLSMIHILAGGPGLVSAGAEDLRVVTVSIAPQKYFVEQIAGNRIRALVMVEPGANPATYEPKPKQLGQVLESQIYFTIGVPFESVWLKQIASVNPKMRIVRTDAGIRKTTLQGHAHDSSAADPHVWLAPPHVKKIAENMLSALIDLDPIAAESYRANCRGFLAAVEALDGELTQ